MEPAIKAAPEAVPRRVPRSRSGRGASPDPASSPADPLDQDHPFAHPRSGCRDRPPRESRPASPRIRSSPPRSAAPAQSPTDPVDIDRPAGHLRPELASRRPRGSSACPIAIPRPDPADLAGGRLRARGDPVAASRRSGTGRRVRPSRCPTERPSLSARAGESDTSVSGVEPRASMGRLVAARQVSVRAMRRGFLFRVRGSVIAHRVEAWVSRSSTSSADHRVAHLRRQVGQVAGRVRDQDRVGPRRAPRFP